MFSLSKERSTSAFIAVLTPFAVATLLWALSGLTIDNLSAGAVTLVVLTAFCSYYLRIELPRFNLHLTISDGLIILSMLLYGGEIALLTALIETAVASLSLVRKGFSIKRKAILANMYFAAIAVYAASKAVTYVFVSTELVLSRGDFTSIIWLVALMAISMFFVTSVFVAVYTALKREQTFWSVWTENCFNAVVMYLTGSVVAAITYVAQAKTDLLLFAGVVGFFGVIYLTFKRFVDDVKRTVGKAKQAELERAEQAEQHVNQLQHYVAELERSGKALQESHENFRHAAYHDALTGLPNRNYFIESLKDLLLKCKGNLGDDFAVLFIDLKSFKTINDSLGHSLGDRLIKKVGQRLSGMVRDDDMVGRFGGDKFGVILKELSSVEEATSFSNRMAKGLAEPYSLEGREVFTSARIGIAYGNSRYSEAEDILRDADIAMYYSKETGDKYVVFDKKMHTRAVTRLQLETDLRYAIERDQFELHYQPIIGLNSASLEGFEALVRWNHPQRGLVPPNEFISIAESTGLIIPMTVKILQSACAQSVKWQSVSQSSTPLSIAVNLSGKHFADPGLVDQIQTVINTTRINPTDLKLEITESAVMENAETAISMLQQIKQTGVQISIDDFGTGYSSLSYLHRFPIDLLKVDRSFVSAMEENTENGEIVRTVIALAKALNLKVVAEGIETIHQFHQLRVLGCEFGQGYLFSKALPVAEIDLLLKDDARWQHILPASEMPIVSQDSDILQIDIAQ